MTELEQREAARQFAIQWLGKDGKEDGEKQSFWLGLLEYVFGVSHPENYIDFEKKVRIDGNLKSIDGYISATRVLIEHKSKNKNLDKPSHNEGTPFDQANYYNNGLNFSEKARWIITTNFDEIRIYNMDDRNAPPEIVYLNNFQDEYKYLDFLVDNSVTEVTKEQDLSLQAGKIVGEIYSALKEQYKDPESDSSLKSLNALCVRLVFCMFADDAGVFGTHDKFYNYMKEIPPKRWHGELTRLFKMLNTNYPERDGYEPDLEEFPYVNGGLFSDENSEIPSFTSEIVDLILEKGCRGFNWSKISPTIFGTVFESTLNPDPRRQGGMHYTSVRNIHKVIDPLFLDGLKMEFEKCKEAKISKAKKQQRLLEFQNKLAHLSFFDPACGSGNFLTETYLSLRRLENEVLRYLYQFSEDQLMFDMFSDSDIGVKVSISQFYGIEINDFAVSVAKTALWIAEAQMLAETRNATSIREDFLPLATNAHIVEGNALLLDWESIIPRANLNYILGNPPFVGARNMTAEQKADIKKIFAGWKNIGNLDYVSCWYKKSVDYMHGTSVRAALVSTNSITQGEQAAILWKPLFKNGVHIDFAHRTFRWDSEAHVHCVIVGFSTAPYTKPKIIFTSTQPQIANNINVYLLDAPNVFIEKRKHPICNVPEVVFGNMPNDDGALSDFSTSKKDEIIEKYPQAEKFFKKFLGATEFLNNKERWCLWLKNASPKEIKDIPPIMEAVTKVKKTREASERKATKLLAAYPTLFGEIRQPETPYIIIPRHSSETRRYIPMGFVSPDIICGDANLLMPDATLYHFGIMTSFIHNAWMRVVAGRLEMRYRYSSTIVYNNFPWPNPTNEQRAKIEKTAQAILDARDNHPQESLADLYDETFMPADLRKAHQDNDRAVMEAYGLNKNSPEFKSESACVAMLMKMYQNLTEKS